MERQHFSLLTCFHFFQIVLVTLEQGKFIVSPFVVVIFYLNLYLFVKKFSFFGVFMSEVGDCLFDFGISFVMPSFEFLVVELVYAGLDEMCLVETL